MAEIRLSGVIRESIVDGPGLRFVVFSQGCLHNCEGCHNPETHDINGGYISHTSRLLEEFKKNPMLKGITISGGEPFLQARENAILAKEVKAMGKDVFTYTGYTFEQLLAGANSKNNWEELLKNSDYLVDGKFVIEKKTLAIPFIGSSNQRILDVEKSLATGKAVLAIPTWHVDHYVSYA